MTPNIGITEKNKAAVSQILQLILADEFVLMLKTRNFHWNVIGMEFSQLHSLFENQYSELEEKIDQVAERIRQLGHYATASLTDFLEQTRLEDPRKIGLSAHEMLKELHADHETMIRQLRNDLQICAEKYQDAGTSDFLTSIMESHEKSAWMLRASLS